MPMTEVFQHVRSQYESKPRTKEKAGPGHAKVVARNEKWFITELLDKWKVDYERRKRHHHTGYFALNHVPYRTFANLKHTDVYDLLGDHLGILMNRHYAFMQLYSRNQPTAEKTESLDTSELHNTIVVVCDEANKNKKVLPPSKNGGLTAIRAALSSDVRVLRDVAAGGSLREALIHKTHRKGSSTEKRATTTSQQDMNWGQTNEAVRTERAIAVVAEGTNSQSENTKTVGPNLYVALAAVHFKNHTCSGSANKSGLRQLKETVSAKRHQRRHTMAKLKSVYAVLCYLYNVKSRDLRNQEPLSYSTVKALAAKPLHSLTKNLPHHFQHHLHVEVHHHPPSSSPQIPHRHSLGHTHRGAMASRHVKVDGSEYAAPVETWEELLHLHNEAEKLQSSSSSFISNSAVAPGAATSVQRPSRMGSSSVHTHQKSHKVLPPWQRQVVFVKSKNESLKRDPAQKLQDCIDSFHYFKSEMSQNVKSTLEDREFQLQLQKHLLTKMEHLVLGPNMDVCLEKMREQAYLIQSQERAEERNKPAWFSLLEKEIKTMFDVQDKEASVMLEKLKQFLHIDIDAVPHVIEKMCLLIMSLPASQLSIQPVMSAIEFVLEHVLKQSPKLLTQLKNLRQLPPITTELRSTPVYVFGYRI